VTIPRGQLIGTAAGTLGVLALWFGIEVWFAFWVLLRPQWREAADKAVHLERNGEGLNARDVAERIPRWLRKRYLREARARAAGYR